MSETPTTTEVLAVLGRALCVSSDTLTISGVLCRPDMIERSRKLAAEIRDLSARLTASSAAAPSGLLNPDMPAQELRLHMGELTAQEERTARAAIRWANSRLSSVTDKSACLSPNENGDTQATAAAPDSAKVAGDVNVANEGGRNDEGNRHVELTEQGLEGGRTVYSKSPVCDIALKSTERQAGVPDGWRPANEAPAGPHRTYRLGEFSASWSTLRIWPDGDREWIAPDGRTTVTHSTYAAPTHYLAITLPPLPTASQESAT